MMDGDHVSLFSGVGMTDRAASAAGFRTHSLVEIDPFCQSVLRRRFPKAQIFGDVALVNEKHLGPFRRPLLVSGGFPCQDVSASGHGVGVALGTRSGLWQHFARIIGELRPDYVLIENSPMLKSRGLNIILDDLVALGYDCNWDCIPAASVGAPHLRDRIFITAWPQSYVRSPAVPTSPTHNYIFPRSGTMRGGIVNPGTIKFPHKLAKQVPSMRLFPTPRAAANEWRTTRNAPSHGNGHGATLAGTLNDMERAAGRPIPPTSESAGNVHPDWVEWLMGLPYGWTDPTVGNDHLPADHAGWHREPAIPRLWSPSPNRRARLHALGNGLVPQVASVALDLLINHP